jgi:ABC-2 type transport system ATP-binding protein
MAIEPVIQLHHIVKTFHLRDSFWRTRPFHAVDDVSLEIHPGEVFGLLGRNGAGKTTLIKVMAGLLVADGGHGRVLGYDIHRDHKQIRANVSLVAPTADVGTDNNLTVRQNLEFWAVVYNVAPRLRAERIDELLTFLDLKQYEAFWPMSISAGMRQRLAIARSLLVQNPILFLDEPTVKLDGPGAQAVRDFIRKINQNFGVTILLTTHLIFEAEELCDRVAIMDRGKIISCDAVERLRRHLRQYDSCTITCSAVPEVVLEQIRADPNIVSCEQAQGKLYLVAEQLELVLFQTLKLLRQHHIDLYAVESHQPTLEEVFVTLLQKEGQL